MEESILKSTKKILNIGDDDPSFDLDIITHINTAFSHLQQLGIGPAEGFEIADDSKTWADFLGENDRLPVKSAVKTSIYLQVRYIFDPPQLSHVLSAMERQIQETDWRLSVLREETDWVNPDPPDPVPEEVT